MSKGRALPVIAVLLLAACHDDSSQAPRLTTPHPKSVPAAKRGPTPEELTAGMVEAVTVGKSTVPVAVKFDLPARPLVGQSLEIVIALLPQVAGSATLQVTGSAGLEVAPAAATIRIPAIEPTQAYRVTITATPTADGVQLLGLGVSLTHDDTTETRTFSVPVIVAASGEAAASNGR